MSRDSNRYASRLRLTARYNFEPHLRVSVYITAYLITVANLLQLPRSERLFIEHNRLTTRISVDITGNACSLYYHRLRIRENIYYCIYPVLNLGGKKH